MSETEDLTAGGVAKPGVVDPRAAGLRHAPRAAGLTITGGRAGLFARGRQAAAVADHDEEYGQAKAALARGDLNLAAEHLRTAASNGHPEAQYLLSTLLDEDAIAAHGADEAAMWERKAAEQNHAYAQANLSFRLYAEGDYAQAFAWCQRAAYARLPWAQFNVGLMYFQGRGVAANDAEAARWYELAAAQNWADAQTRLAELYSLGRGVPLDAERSAMWYRRAAEQGSAEAQFQLGHMYAAGRGVPHDYVLSRHWLRQAAAQGHAQAVQEVKRRLYRDA